MSNRRGYINFDIRPIFYLAFVGVCVGLPVLAGGAVWLLYHLSRAVLLYVGWLP